MTAVFVFKTKSFVILVSDRMEVTKSESGDVTAVCDVRKIRSGESKIICGLGLANYLNIMKDFYLNDVDSKNVLNSMSDYSNVIKKLMRQDHALESNLIYAYSAISGDSQFIRLVRLNCASGLHYDLAGVNPVLYAPIDMAQLRTIEQDAANTISLLDPYGDQIKYSIECVVVLRNLMKKIHHSNPGRFSENSDYSVIFADGSILSN